MASILAAHGNFEPISCLADSQKLGGKSKTTAVQCEEYEIWICDPDTKEMFLACSRLGRVEALSWCAEFMANDERVGCLVVPSIQTIPKRFKRAN